MTGLTAPGITIDNAGRFAITPTAPGDLRFKVDVQDSAGNTDSRVFTRPVKPAGPRITTLPANLPRATVGVRSTTRSRRLTARLPIRDHCPRPWRTSPSIRIPDN